MKRAFGLLTLLVSVGLVLGGPPADAGPLAGLAPSNGRDDDARTAVAIGAAGEIYAPDGSGGWVRTKPFTTADTLSVIGRAGGAIVAWGDGVVYKLAENGWSAIRLHQTQKATMSGGPRAVAAVRRQIYALDRVRAGEPEKIALSPLDIRQIGSGNAGAKTGIVIATANGLLRVEGTKLVPIAKAPTQVTRLLDDRWALVQGGVVDLTAGKSWPWPASTVIGATQTSGDRLDAVATIAGKLELVTLERGKLSRVPIAVTPIAAAVGLVFDRAGRVTIALADGRIVTRTGQSWAVTTVRDALPPAHPGSPPARSP